jgi:hypothetical protein
MILDKAAGMAVISEMLRILPWSVQKFLSRIMFLSFS